MPLVKKTRKVSLPTMYRKAHIEPKSIDKEKRTVDVIFTKGARVLRHGFFETFFEELGLEKKNVRMKRLQSGNAPVLDTHGRSARSGVDSVLGVVQSAELIPGKEGRATLRFSKRDNVEPVFQDIQDGIIRNISVGYNTFKFEKVGEENDVPIFRATDWEPLEISPVPAGADAGAVIRSENEVMTDCILEESVEEERTIETPESEKTIDPVNEKLENEKNLRDTQTKQGENNVTPEEIEKMEKEARKQGAADENKRQLEIRSIVKKVKLDDEVAEKYITDNKSIDEVRTLVIDALAEKDKDPKNQTRATNVEMGEDIGRKSRVEGMTSAILHRFRPEQIKYRENGQNIVLPGYKIEDCGREYAYMSLVDMARECLLQAQIRANMPRHKIADVALNNTRAGGVHSITDFPEILANVINKTLRGGYDAAPQTFQPFTAEVFVSDFKEISRTNLGDAPKLLKVEEGSEVKRGSMSEAAEKYRVEEFARIVAVSRKIIVNDDLAAFTKIPERMGRRAADLESDTVWAILLANANLADAIALFATAHGNLSTSPAAPSEVGLTESRAAMRRQTGLDGAEISLTPAWIFVPPAHETATEKLIAVTRPTQPSEVNPFGPSGRTTLQMDVEPRIETLAGGSLTQWYITANKGQIDMIELARLEGTNGPQTQTRDGFDVAGLETKIMHDIGAKAIDFRGLFKNAGA